MERRTIAVIVFVVLFIVGFAALYEWNHEHVYDNDLEYTYSLSVSDSPIGGQSAGTGRYYVIADVTVTVDGSKDLSVDDVGAHFTYNGHSYRQNAYATSQLGNPDTVQHGDTVTLRFASRLPVSLGDLSGLGFYITVDGWDVTAHRPSYTLGAILAV